MSDKAAPLSAQEIARTFTRNNDKTFGPCHCIVKRYRTCLRCLQEDVLRQSIDQHARAQNATMREIILDLTPTCRKRGECWCPSFYSVENHGHGALCNEARAALAEGETG